MHFLCNIFAVRHQGPGELTNGHTGGKEELTINKYNMGKHVRKGEGKVKVQINYTGLHSGNPGGRQTVQRQCKSHDEQTQEKQLNIENHISSQQQDGR